MKRSDCPRWIWTLLAINVVQVVLIFLWLMTRPLLAQPEPAGSYQICGDGQGRVFIVSTRTGRVKWVNPGSDPARWGLNSEFWQIPGR